MKFIVGITRSLTQCKDISVEANTAAEAQEKAVQEAPNHDFGGLEKESEYTADEAILEEYDA